MVNIVIPYYKSEKTIRDTFNSLVAQTKKMFIITLVDDCSDDNIKDIISEYSKKLHISYLKTEKNSGPGAARNVGIKNAIKNGYDYIIFVDSDDILNPRAVEVLYTEAKKKDADVVFSNILCERQRSTPLIVDSTKNITWTHGKIYKVSYLQKNNILFFEDIKYNEDASFNQLTFAMGRSYFVPEILYIWRDNKDSITRRKNGDFITHCYKDIVLGTCHVLEFLQFSEYSKKAIKNALENLYTHYELQKITDVTQIEQLKKQITKVLADPFYDELGFKTIPELDKIKNISQINGKLVLFPDSFRDWLIEVGKENWVKEIEKND